MLPTTFDQASAFADAVARSSFVPDAFRGKPGDVLACIIAGHELGIGPMQALRSIHVVKGKPILSADLMVALCKRSGVCRYFRLVESTPERAVYETQREGDPEPTRLVWTMQDAKRARLTGNGNWQKHPAAMLRARCSSALARAVYPDLVAGIYEDDEAREIGGRDNGGRAARSAPTEFPGASMYGGTEPPREHVEPPPRPEPEPAPMFEDAEVIDEAEVVDQAPAFDAQGRAFALFQHVLGYEPSAVTAAHAGVQHRVQTKWPRSAWPLAGEAWDRATEVFALAADALDNIAQGVDIDGERDRIADVTRGWPEAYQRSAAARYHALLAPQAAVLDAPALPRK
ncbi:MAG: recombinase RecT [Bacteroidota bacterium]